MKERIMKNMGTVSFFGSEASILQE